MEQPPASFEPIVKSTSAKQSKSLPQPATSASDDESQFIAKHAQALQEFLSKPAVVAASTSGTAGTSGSTKQHTAASDNHYYYIPAPDSVKDNKITSSSATGSSA